MGAGGSHRPCERPAPARRARRARKRAWAGWASARSPRRTVRSAQGCSDALTRASRAPRGILMGAGGSHAPCARPAPARRAQRARAEAPRGPRGSGAAHGTTRRSATLAQMEHVRAPTFGDALRATKTHPATPDTLGARVVAVLGPLVSRRPPRGGGIQRNARIEPLVERAEGPRPVWVDLTSG